MPRAKKVASVKPRQSHNNVPVLLFFLLGINGAFVLFCFYLLPPLAADIHGILKTRFAHSPASIVAENRAISSAKLTTTQIASISTAPKPKPSVFIGRSVFVPILMYHYVGLNPDKRDHARDILSITPDNFEAQLEYLKTAGFTTIDFETFYNGLKGVGILPPKPVLLTFDDGYIDFFINAYPLLQKYQAKATVFIPTGLVGSSYYLYWEQIKQMQRSGLVSFQAHSVNHVNLVGLSAEPLRYEVEESRKMLSEQLGAPVDYFAYPFGESNEAVLNAVKAAGFKAAVGTWYGNVHTEGTQYNLPRIRISGNLDLQGFTQKVR